MTGYLAHRMTMVLLFVSISAISFGQRADAENSDEDTRLTRKEKRQQSTQQDPADEPVLSDSTSRIVVVDKILLTGNKKTKDYIILREMDVVPNVKYDFKELLELLDTDRNKIYNTSLFNVVEIVTYDLTPERVVVQVDVKERWYLYPIPKIDFVDRNFNDWIQNQGADWSRVNWGIKFTQYNFRGRNERLALLLQGGYTKQAGLQYSIPYIDKNQRTGLSVRVDYGENTNTAYNDIENVIKFVDSDQIIRRQFYSGISMTRRNSFYNTHQVGFDYNNTWVGDTVISLNPTYFNESANQQQMISLGYSYTSDHRDIIAYPLNGYKFKVSVLKRGIGVFDDVNLFSTRVSYSKYWPLKSKFFLSNYSSAFVSFPAKQDYANSTGVGFGNETIRGYELFVVRGRSFVLNKTTFKKQLVSFTKNLNAIPLEQFQTFPFALYLKTYFDFGYVTEITNTDLNTSFLNDKFIWGAGLGFDVFTMYDLVIRTEFSVNSELQSGLFVHFKKDF